MRNRRLLRVCRMSEGEMEALTGMTGENWVATPSCMPMRVPPGARQPLEINNHSRVRLFRV